MASASVYFRSDSVYIIASEKNTFGIIQSTSTYTRLRADVPPRAIGDAVLEALAAFRENVPGRVYVRGVKQPPDPFLSAAGFKSWKGFEQGAKYFHVSAAGETISVMPSTALPKGGFGHQPDATVTCVADPEEIGAVLHRMAAR